MKPVYITATDIDFATSLRQAVRALVPNQDFLAANDDDKKAAICMLANAFSVSNSILSGWEYRDHLEYLQRIVTVSSSKPTNDPDVFLTYYPSTREVYYND